MPASAFAVGESKWDCKLASDGQTWDCSTSIEKPKVVEKIAKTAPKPIVVAKPVTSPVPKTGEEKPHNVTVATPITRVRLSASPVTDPTAATPLGVTAISRSGNWDCKADTKGTWDCSQQQSPVLTTALVKKSGDWHCKASNKGVWDCSQSDAPVYIQPIPNSTPTTTAVRNSRIGDNAIFTQMASQLSVDPWSTCDASTQRNVFNNSPLDKTRNNAVAHIEANYAELLNQNNALFSGDVVIRRADQYLTADQVIYKNITGHANATGDVFYKEQGFALHSQQAQLQLQNNTGQFTNNRFILEASHARGTTRTTHLINKDISQSTHVTYSTCKPSETDWQLEASSMELNNETGRGTARHVWLEFLDVPFLYTPYISFPIDDRRQSGFLVPTVGASDTTGFDFSIPYYWNIAPNYDATITPRIMSDRGLMLGGEFRYLSKQSEGQISAEVLEDADLNQTRGQFSFQDNTHFSSRLTSLVDLNYMSDDDYLDDFGNTLSIASSRYIKSQAQLNYRADNWNLLAKVDNYDSIDRSISSVTRPHRRLPQILFTLQPTDVFGIGKVDMRSEFTYFDHSSRTKAKRLDIRPSISFPYQTPSSFVTPKLTVRHTEYRFDNQNVGIDATQSRTLPILSLDSGLFFERDLTIGNGVIQTLEPRAYFLYVPHESQDDIPLFDTSEYDFSFNQLFRDNRFSGADRVADANQLTLALTSRFLESDSGKERLRASIGSIIYFDDLDVTLTPTSTPISHSSSDLVAEISTSLTEHWSARSALQYDPHASKTQKATIGFHYRNGHNKLFNATYRSRFEAASDDIEQTDLSFKWPISKTWSSVGRWNYSTEHNLTLESFLGIEKDTCCWRFRVIARRYVNDAFDEKPKQGLFFQLELKGLSSFGEKLDAFLEEGILGYQVPKQ